MFLASCRLEIGCEVTGLNESEVLKKHEAQSQSIGTASQPDYGILEDMYLPSFFTSFTG